MSKPKACVCVHSLTRSPRLFVNTRPYSFVNLAYRLIDNWSLFKQLPSNAERVVLSQAPNPINEWEWVSSSADVNLSLCHLFADEALGLAQAAIVKKWHSNSWHTEHRHVQMCRARTGAGRYTLAADRVRRQRDDDFCCSVNSCRRRDKNTQVLLELLLNVYLKT